MMRIHPQLGHQKDLFPWNATSLDRIARLTFGTIDLGCVDMSIAQLQGFEDGFFLSFGILECSESKCWPDWLVSIEA